MSDERGAPSTGEPAGPAVLKTERRDGALRLQLSGRLDARGTGAVWNPALAAMDAVGGGSIVVDAAGVEYCDGVGLALLQQLRLRGQDRGAAVEIAGLADRFSKLLDLSATGHLQPGEGRHLLSPVARLGRLAATLWRELGQHVSFLGQVLAALVGALRGRHRVRWRETLRIAQEMGADALPMVTMISFLSGSVISLKVARSLSEFGDMMEMAVFNATAMTSTLAPLLTTVIVVGRSTSAFAAELATMRVNEELDALVVMGIDPVPYLALNRVLAGLFSVPLLAVFFEFFGLLGGLVVWSSFGYTPEAYLEQIRQTIQLHAVLGSLAKTFTFGIMAAMLGCFYGLRQGSVGGARAVAEAATRAVVVGIIAIALTDSAFSVLFYFLKV